MTIDDCSVTHNSAGETDALYGMGALIGATDGGNVTDHAPESIDG